MVLEKIDITPSPRVLRMLGQIDFKPWQCLAELIDNSIDALLSTSAGPRDITVDLPTADQLAAGAGEISISDSGAGMTKEELSQAVRAGYSGNDPVEKLGLFGMGFNIATARLGRRTEVWTLQRDAEKWIGVIIDFDELERGQAFLADAAAQPRRMGEEDRHGTVVRISKLDADRVKQLVAGRGKGYTKQRLGRVYSRLIEDRGVIIRYAGEQIRPRRHCVWSQTRTVEAHPFGLVPAVIPIDENLGSGRYCSTCWTWLAPDDEVCPTCGLSSAILTRDRVIRGWIGLQRFFDLDHYGFDLIRNGRVIEELDKSLFFWSNEEDERLEKEYPIDAMYLGGRFVGEIEIDFVRVSHQKDAFDKHDPNWREVVKTIRGDSPIRPRVAEQFNLPRNTSPLARLFAAFRQTSPAGLRNLIPGDANGKGVFEEAKRWAEQYWAGSAEYQSDAKWYEAAELAERARRRPASPAAVDEAAGSMPVGGEEGPDDGEPLEPGVSHEPTFENDPSLSATYELPDMPGTPMLKVVARLIVGGRLDGDVPASLDVKGNAAFFLYDLQHPAFTESLDTPEEFLLSEVAYQLLLRSGERQTTWPLSRVEGQLRTRYFKESETGMSVLGGRATTFLDQLRAHLTDVLAEKAPLTDADLTDRELDDLRTALAAQGGGEARVEQALKEGTVARHLDRSFLLRALERWPDLVLDGRFLAIDYTDVVPDKRMLAVTQAAGLLADVAWLADQAAAPRVGPMAIWREQLARAAAGLNLLEQWRATNGGG